MHKITLSNKTFGIEKLTVMEAIKLQMKVVKILGSGILKALNKLDLSNLTKMDTNEVFSVISEIIESTDEKEVYGLINFTLSKNVFIIGNAEDEDVKVKLIPDVHLKDEPMDVYFLAFEVIKLNVGKSILSKMSSLSSLLEK